MSRHVYDGPRCYRLRIRSRGPFLAVLPPLALGAIALLTLKLFITIIEEQSIAKAAERESIAASAVSKRISDLEHAVGVCRSSGCST